jgi:hypothetical protein
VTSIRLDSSTPDYLASTEHASNGPESVELSFVRLLSGTLDVANVEYDRVDRYYTGDQPMSYLAPEIRAQIGHRFARMVINWPETIVDSVTRRLNVEGFRLGQGGEADDELWRIFTANQLDEETPLGIADALIHGIAYLSVWGNDADPSTPIITFESAHQVAVDYDPGGRTVRAALKRWQDGGTAYATLYLRDRVVKYAARATDLVTPTAPRYEVVDVLPNPLGAVPIVPLVNRGRLLNRSGRSELASIAPIADGINKLASDLLVTSEFYVTPRRYVTGLAVPPGAERERFQAEMKQYWEDAPKSKFLVAGNGASFGQFPEASLDAFVQGINLLTASLAAIGGLPPDDLGLNTTNPASAEARRAAETTLILRAKEKWRPFGGGLARAMRLAIAARDGVRLDEIAQDFNRMQVAWQDPATPAIAQAMDAAVKGVESGVYDVEAAQETVGLSPVERAAIKARAEEAANVAATADVRAKLALAAELQNGPMALSLNAALAAVGLFQAAAQNSADAGAPNVP